MTIRTNAALQTLFADNTAGAISPQDLRDFLDSIMGVYGSIVLASGVTGQTLATDTPEQLTEWTADGLSNGMTPAFGSDQITIDNSGDYEVAFQASFDGTTGETFLFTLYKNGSPLSPILGCRRKTGTADVGSCSFIGQVALVATDILSIWIESDAAGTPVVRDAQLTVKRLG
jgi:hypothetical protein